MILKEKISKEELIRNSNLDYPDMIKFCIDKRNHKVSVDEEMYHDMEMELYDDGSELSDIFGGNIYHQNGSVTRIVWGAHPNIERNRELNIGQGRMLTDETTISELSEILEEWII